MLEFHINTTKQHAEGISNQLSFLGAVAITWKDAANQPIYEPLPGEIIEWQTTTVIALFDDPCISAGIPDFLTQLQQENILDSFSSHDVAAQDWVRSSLDQFQATAFGHRLWICPSWQSPPDPNAINVSLDPGLAFGTGTHPTTALCLQWLDTHIQGNEIIMDYGCGSGILAVAALKLGAKHAIAIDHDPQALLACEMNLQQNHLPASSLQLLTPENVGAPQVDILLANILAQPLIELAPIFANYCKANASIVLSGILTDQTQAVIDAYLPWFTIIETKTHDEWVRIEGKRKNSSSL